VRRFVLATRAAALMAGLIGAMAGLPGVVFATGDPFVGTWVMDPQRSRYESGDVPRHMVIVMSATGRGIHYRSDTTLSDGNRVSSEYAAEYDGGLAMVVGNAGVMAPVVLKLIDERTIECSYMKGNRVVATSRRIISENGSTMTISTVSQTKDGTTGTNVAVFARVQ
jgi:hypothetical protein